MGNIDRTSLLKDIQEWKAELGLPSEPRAQKSLAVVSPLYFEVIGPVIQDYQRSMQVFADLFESSNSVATVNVGMDDKGQATFNS